MATVKLKNITKNFGSVEVIRNANIDIKDSEFVALVGPSGCGKSTILRMIAGLEDVTSGEIEIGGNVVNAVAPSERQVAMVFQSYALYPHMTVRQNMSFGLEVTNHPKGNWKLVVLINGKEALSKDVTETKWQRFEVDLSKYAGKTVNVELRNQATGWSHEAAYWSRIAIKR